MAILVYQFVECSFFHYLAFISEAGITLVFDCTDLEYVSSSGLRVILTAHKMITGKSGKFILRNLNRTVRQVIDLTGFSRILTIE